MVSSDSGFVTIPTPRLTIEGRSRAGVETFFRIRELGVVLDIGRCPDMVVGTRDVFITHAHLDHALGVPFYAAQRKLQSLPAGNVYVPAETAERFHNLIRAHEALEDTTYEMNLVGIAAGETIALRRSVAVRAHRAPHRLVANAYEFLEPRHKLRSELENVSGNEIAAMRKEGIDVERHSTQSLLFYTGDTDRGILETGDAIFHSEVLMIECSFTGPDDYRKAVDYQHIHADDIFEFADRFENELVVLTHFSMRDSPAEIHSRLSSRCPDRLRSRIRLVLPDPYSSLSISS